jgi:hypothetical protein
LDGSLKKLFVFIVDWKYAEETRSPKVFKRVLSVFDLLL